MKKAYESASSTYLYATTLNDEQMPKLNLEIDERNRLYKIKF